MKDLFFYEKSSQIEPCNVKIHWKIKKHLYSEQSFYQKIDFYDSYDHGIIFALDDTLMCSERDEFIYHESMAYISNFSHLNPKSVLVIGGGDGGLIHQLIKLSYLTQIDLCEIDPLVIEKCKEYLPYLNKSLKDPRVNLHVEDGFHFLKLHQKTYDIILIDSTDPIGEAKKLFSEDFYTLLKGSLNKDGLFIMQSGSPFYNKEFLINNYLLIKNYFPIVKIFTSPCHSYPGGYWGFIFGSKTYHYSNFQEQVYEKEKNSFEYYNEFIHMASFALPNYLLKHIKK